MAKKVSQEEAIMSETVLPHDSILVKTDTSLLPLSPEHEAMPLSPSDMIEISQMSATEEMEIRASDTTKGGMLDIASDTLYPGRSTRLLLHNTELPMLGDFFQFRECIGVGGFCHIHKAFDLVLNREVAIKTLRDEHNTKFSKRNSFISEAKVTAALDHPNIIPTHGLYTDEKNQLHLVIKLIEGKNLKELILEQIRDYQGMSHDQLAKMERSRLIARLEIFLKICDAINYAHNKKILHRDLKPENVMVGQFNQVYVMDWGIAEIRETKTQQKKESVQGTLQYLAPEIATSLSYDSRSDIYSLGVLLYNLVFLKKPFPDQVDTDEFYFLKLKKQPPAMKHSLGIRVPNALHRIVGKAMAVQSADRYQTVQALANDLHQFLYETHGANSALGRLCRFLSSIFRA